MCTSPSYASMFLSEGLPSEKNLWTRECLRKRIRPELERLNKRVKRGGIDAVIVSRFDRFARSTAELARALEEFDALGVDFISLYEQIDTTTLGGRLAYHVFAAAAEFEAGLIRERIKAGLRAARRRGKRLGRPPTKVDIEEVTRLRAAGLGWRAIGNRMGLAASTIRGRFRAACENPSLGETIQAPRPGHP